MPSRLIAIVLLFLCGIAGASEVETSFTPAVIDVLQSPLRSTAEYDAMVAAIRLAQREREAPITAQEHAVVAQNLATRAVDAIGHIKAAAAFELAARLAPWIGEYHFRRGVELQKAGENAEAADAFRLYLLSSTDAKDRREVNALINALDQSPETDQAGRELKTFKPGEYLRECADCPELVVVPAGKFVMGSPSNEEGRFDSEGPTHTVLVPSFAVGVSPVTEREYSVFLTATRYQPGVCNLIWHMSWQVMANGHVIPPGDADLPTQPATCLNLKDMQAYIDWLNLKVPSYTDAMFAYRLPSEAEWEYAARANTRSARWWGEAIGKNNANCQGCGSKWDNTLVAPVDSFNANAFGLNDPLGNMWQMTQDCWNENYAGAPPDGTPWTAGDCSRHVVRGGSWSNLPVFVRSAARSKALIDGSDHDTSGYVGFRVAKSIQGDYRPASAKLNSISNSRRAPLSQSGK